MASLHASLKYLAPITFSDLPTQENELDTWLTDLFSNTQCILDSIPIGEPSEQSATPKTSSSSLASNASEVTASSARSPPPIPEYYALQKEWGKPLKLGAKESALGMSVHKLGGKDGRGAWFARRSVHEGLPFSKFKKALEMEFPESLAVQGAPGEGNVRGIGGETKVENIKKSSKGRVEVYRLSAQFPGPTTPRDFVTMLITSDSAMDPAKKGEPVPRHYLIVSKPCDHPETQPQSGFIRGYYESVEFIREVPRQTPTTHSAADLSQQHHHHHGEDIGKEAQIRNARQHVNTLSSHEDSPLVTDSNNPSQASSVTDPVKPPQLADLDEHLPVEWIMITRSDPGGSVPRFMVERGTPSSICADAEKFLNWACQQDFDNVVPEVTNEKALQSGANDHLASPISERRASFQSFRSSRMVGVQDATTLTQTADLESEPTAEKTIAKDASEVNQQQQGGVMSAVSSAGQYLSTYTPQIILDHLPGNSTTDPQQSQDSSELAVQSTPPQREDDATSIASFESADSHLTRGESETASVSSSKATLPRKSEEHLSQHEKELRKLEQRRAALENKFSESRSKLEQNATAQSAKDEVAKQKAAEKHDRELKKQQEKYEKEVSKLNQKQEKEKQKMEERKRKQADKDEKSRLTRERDEARQELELLKKEAAMLRNVVADLQKENTTLVARLGDDARSLSRYTSPRKSRERSHTLSGSDSASMSMKSQ